MPMFNYNNVDNIQICMDVPFVDHPYLIGPRGRKCQHLMDRYRSLIHFPDSNRRQNGPKLNNVVIHGSSKNAEELRFQIRSRTPIRLAVLLQDVPDAAALCGRIETAIIERSLPIRFNRTENFSNAMLKTEWRNEEVLMKFCDEFFPQNVSASANAKAGLDSPTAGSGGELFTMALTVLPVLNPWNAELSHRLIDHIHEATGACVFYPPKEMFADQPPSYFIKAGDVESVLQAGKYLLGLTMFQVSFIVPSNIQLDLQETIDWQRDLLVHTAIEPVFSNPHSNSNGGGGGGKAEFLHNRAVLRSFEFCLNSVYFVRSLLLGFKKTVQSSQYNFMADVKRMIPHSVFSEGQLYFPLYGIDDDRSFDFGTAGAEFFQKFYGGPYSLQAAHEQEKRDRSSFYGSSLDQGGGLYHNNSNNVGNLAMGGGGYRAITNPANNCSLADSKLSLDSSSLMTMMMDSAAPNFHQHHDAVFSTTAAMYGAPTASPLNNNHFGGLGGGGGYKDKITVPSAFDMSLMASALPQLPPNATTAWNPATGGGYIYGSEDNGGSYGFYGGLNAAPVGPHDNAHGMDYYATATAMAPSNVWNTAAVGNHVGYYNQPNNAIEMSNGGYGFYDANNNGGPGEHVDYYATMMVGGCQPSDIGPIDGSIYEGTTGVASSKRKSASF